MYNCPSGNYYDYRAFAMGARSQVGRGLAAGRLPRLLKFFLWLFVRSTNNARLLCCSEGAVACRAKALWPQPPSDMQTHSHPPPRCHPIPPPPTCASQAAKTYLERNFEQFDGLGLDALISHALQALHASLQVRRLQRQTGHKGGGAAALHFAAAIMPLTASSPFPPK